MKVRHLDVTDEAGNVRVAIRAIGDGASIELRDIQGKALVSLQADHDHASLRIGGYVVSLDSVLAALLDGGP